MTDEEDWVARRLRLATDLVSAPPATIATLASLLRGVFQERVMTPGDLTKVADILLANHEVPKPEND